MFDVIAPATLGLRAGAPPPDDLADRLEARLRETGDHVRERLVAEGRWHPRAHPPRLELPAGFRAMILRALGFEAEEAAPGWEGRVESILSHYLGLMPAQRVEQLALATEPHATLFHTPLDWGRLTRLRRGIEGLFGLILGAGLDPREALGASSPEAFTISHRTLASIYEHTHFGGLMPILYGFPADLAAYARELARGDDPRDPHEVIDRRLAAPLVHELSHLHRARAPIAPPYLDECVAGYLGVLALPSLEIPGAGEDGALFMAPWFAQVGRALARVVGLEPLVRAHAGAAGWEEVLPPGARAAFEALGWEQYVTDRGLHFLGDSAQPDPWVKALYLAAGGALPHPPTLGELAGTAWEDVPTPPLTEEDLAWAGAALAGLCLEASLEQGAFRVRRCPRPVALQLDLGACSVRRLERLSPVEPEGMRLLLPPSFVAALRRGGRSPAGEAPVEAAVTVESARDVVQRLLQGGTEQSP